MIQISNVHMTHILAVCATSPVGTCTLASNQSAVKILTTLFWTQPIAILTHMLVNKFDMPIFQHTIIWLPKILKSNQSDSFSLASFYCSCTAVLHFIFFKAHVTHVQRFSFLRFARMVVPSFICIAHRGPPPSCNQPPWFKAKTFNGDSTKTIPKLNMQDV